MKIGIAQARPFPGDISANIESHKKLIELAVSHQAHIIIFPELSLTGYEPTLAKSLATHQHDSRFDDFQKISDTDRISIGVGVPIISPAGICISMILFQAHQERRTYSKKYLHPDEDEFFVRGQNFPVIKIEDSQIALAICFELSVPEHADHAFKYGTQIYLASVAKFECGLDPAFHSLAEIASNNSAITMMVNSIGLSDGDVCAGNSAVWNADGQLLAQLNDTQEGILVVDTVTKTIISQYL